MLGSCFVRLAEAGSVKDVGKVIFDVMDGQRSFINGRKEFSL